jgi:competence protein ComEC
MDACATADVIVIDDATAKNVCRWKDVLVVTKRDLALSGSAAITFQNDAAAGLASGLPTIEYAFSRPFRPWHEQRRFSREARGLPPYRRQAADPAEASPSSERSTVSPADPAGLEASQ